MEMKNILAALFILMSVSGAVFAQDKTAAIEALKQANKELELNYKEKKFDQALAPAEESVRLSLEAYGPENVETAIAYSNLGAVFRELKKHGQALENYQKAVSIYRKDEANNGRALAKAILNLADSLKAQHKFEEAEIAYKDALAAAEKHFGAEDKNLLPFLYSLINLYSEKNIVKNPKAILGSLQKDDVSTVIELLIRSQSIAAKFFTSDSPERENLADQFYYFGLQNLNQKEFQDALNRFHGIPEFEMEKVKGKLVAKGVLNGKALKLEAPGYPAVARAVGAEGKVGVRVLIDEAGKVISARAVSGHPLLRIVAVQAAKKSIFAPTLFQGKPVMVSGMIVYRFQS